MADGPENCVAQKTTVLGEPWSPIIFSCLLQTRVPLEVVLIRAHDAVDILEHIALGANTTGLGAIMSGLGASMSGLGA